MCAKKFLSTPSARRATIISSIIVLPLSISIHALREEGDIVHGIGESLSFISIHALREEGDQGAVDIAQATQISIHALREEGDVVVVVVRSVEMLFLSTPSARRATSSNPDDPTRPTEFLSTPSARRATREHTLHCADSTISIHALREEGDRLPLMLLLFA